MFERIKDCLCHPKFIGKYHRDGFGIIFLTCLIFFLLYAVIFGVRCYTENPFDTNSSNAVASSIVQHGAEKAIYDDLNKSLTGQSFTINGNGFNLYVLPIDDKIKNVSQSVSIILKEKEAFIYYGIRKISAIKYQDISVDSFNFSDVALNDVASIYNFKLFIGQVLNCSNVYFQTVNLIEGLINILMYFIICVICSVILSNLINPTIDRKTRIKLCIYDCCIFLVGAFFTSLFNIGWFIYVSISFPVIYTIITFRHIVRIVIKNV